MGEEKSAADLVAELLKRGVKVLPGFDLNRSKAECPHCGHIGPIEADFGTRVMRGEIWPQSWCRACRSGRKGKAAAKFWAERERGE